MNGSADDRGVGDYAYVRPAARPTKGELPKLKCPDEPDLYDPYDDGLNPARGVINGCIMGVGLIIALYVIYLAADYALNAFLGG